MCSKNERLLVESTGCVYKCDLISLLRFTTAKRMTCIVYVKVYMMV